MNSKVYKWCAVPSCKNTSIRNPKKVFVHVPTKKMIRDKWLQLAHRNPNDVNTNSPIYFCEDHFDLPNDMENYMEYHVMGSVSQVRMKPGCMPHKFIFQPDRNSQTSSTREQPYIIVKKRRIKILDKSKLTSEKIASCSSDSSISVKSLETKYPSDCCKKIEDDKRTEDLNALEFTLKKIEKSPYYYIGIPLSCYHLVNLIKEQTDIPFNHILLCLKKIRLNNSFCELADDFGIDRSSTSKIFFKNIPIIANVMRPFIVPLNAESIKRSLPIAFRHKYNNVTCIIDCLEIEIKKPSKALYQDVSWSNYKKAYTIKYFISCTPNGLINYISNGYGGRITDTSIVETCDFLKCLRPNMWVMADRGFKHIEVYLQKMGVVLVRPPSKSTKAKAIEDTQIASLTIHVEHAIRQLREFNMLKPNACLNLSLVKVLDDVISIACGLINIQDSLIE